MNPTDIGTRWLVMLVAALVFAPLATALADVEVSILVYHRLGVKAENEMTVI